MQNGEQPNGLAVYTVIVLRHEHAYLLLQRSATKRLWPGFWTGVGGKVEQDEYDNLRAAALRELVEETGLTQDDLEDFVLRRVLLHARPGFPLTVLLYFTGTLQRRVLPACSEGELAWVTVDQLGQLPIIGSTRPVMPLLIADCERDPHGVEAARLGIAHFQADGEVDQLAWV